jgi:hypothetical protein
VLEILLEHSVGFLWVNTTKNAEVITLEGKGLHWSKASRAGFRWIRSDTLSRATATAHLRARYADYSIY